MLDKFCAKKYDEDSYERPYFFENKEWYYYDMDKDKCFLTDKAPRKAIDSYNEWYKDKFHGDEIWD